MDYKYLASIERLIARNRRFRKESFPDRYRRRIAELRAAESERLDLAEQVELNSERKSEAMQNEMEARRNLRRIVEREAEKQRRLEERLQEVREHRAAMEKKCQELDEQVSEKTSHGEFAVQQLRSQVENVCAQIDRRAKRNLDSYIASLRAMSEESVVPSYSQLPGGAQG